MEIKLRVQGWLLDCILDHTTFGYPTSTHVRQACLAVIDDYSIELDLGGMQKRFIKAQIEEKEEFLECLEVLKKKHIEQLDTYKKALKKSKKKEEDDEEEDD